MVAKSGVDCLQEGILPPLLWANLLDDFLEELPAKCFSCLGYADIQAIMLKGKFAEMIYEPTPIALNMVNNWYNQEKLSGYLRMP